MSISCNKLLYTNHTPLMNFIHKAHETMEFDGTCGVVKAICIKNSFVSLHVSQGKILETSRHKLFVLYSTGVAVSVEQ